VACGRRRGGSAWVRRGEGWGCERGDREVGRNNLRVLRRMG
jgi:hypothetical protein